MLSSQLVGSGKRVLIVSLPAAVTDETSPPILSEVRTRLPRVPGSGLVIDFAAVELINSIGITCLLQAEEECHRTGAKMVLAAIPSPIVQFFKQVGLGRRWTQHATIDEAVAAIEQGASRPRN